MTKIILMGLPATGKGIMARKLSEKYRIPHISSGDILRSIVSEGAQLGRYIDKFQSNGNLVPEEIVIPIIAERLRQPDCQQGYILDGFPRTLNQAFFLDEKFSADRFTILIELSPTESMTRIVSRLTCSNPECRASYDLTKERFKPKKHGICDRCYAKLVQRSDDDKQVIINRINGLLNEMHWLKDYYSKQSRLGIIQNNDSPDDDFEKAVEFLNNYYSNNNYIK